MNSSDLVTQITFDAQNHPDPSRRFLYEAVLNQIQSRNGHFDKLLSVGEHRSLDARHFSNLIAHCLEYFLITGQIRSDKLYSQFGVKQWNEIMDSVQASPTLSSTFTTLLRTKTVQTNKYQRYVGAHSLAKLFFGSKQIVAADIGCSLNIGLLGMSAGLPFSEVIDHTKNHLVSESATSRVNLLWSVGVDINNPAEDLDWILACSFYPSEIHELADFASTMQRLKVVAKDKVLFEQGDLLRLRTLWSAKGFPKLDLMMANTVLYQLSVDQRNRFLQEATAVVQPNGILVISDFVSLVGTELAWMPAWKTTGKRFRTVLLRNTVTGFCQPQECFVWDTTRCREVWPGQDYESLVEKRSS